MVWLNRTYYSLLKLQAKFSKFPQSNSSELCKFRAVRPPQSANSPKIHTFYIMFQAPAPAENPVEFQRITQILCNSPTQSANYAKFAHFVSLFYIMFQAPAPAENPAEFQ